MPRVTPKRASPVFNVRPVSLPSNARDQLAELLGFPGFDFLQDASDRQLGEGKILRRVQGEPILIAKGKSKSKGSSLPDIGQSIHDIERALALCNDGAAHLDHIPRSADYIAVARSIAKKSGALLAEVSDISSYYRDALTAFGADIAALEISVARMFDSAKALINTHIGKSSKGARKDVALRAGIRELRKIFRKYGAPRDRERRAHGAFVKRSPDETAELAFVSFALQEGGIKRANYLAKELPRLMRHPNCTLDDLESN